jgi:Raf kinase inhibitor-like YbhB/YbcL family protein
MPVTKLTVTSTAFKNDEQIPIKYTCDGEEINPPLHIDGIPEEAKSLVLIVDDPDAPRGVFDHWLVWNIETRTTIAEGSIPGVVGINGFGKTAYGGPCPPSGVHRYLFKVFALDSNLNLPAGADKKTLEQAMHSHVIADGELIGRYSKK